MFTALLKRKTRESGFTMIELLVAVVIIAILAAIAVPVYLNLKNEAAKSALKSDVNATVKAAAIALTQGTDINTIILNGGAAYVPADPAKGEVITIVKAAAPANATGAAFIQDRDNSSDGYVIKSATYTGSASGVANAKAVISTADDQYFFVYGVLSKAAGAPVDYTYSYTSAKDQYSQSGSNGTGTGTTPLAPSLATATLPAATIGDAYSSSVITASGTPAPSFKAAGLPVGLTIDSATGAISGNSTDNAGTFTITVTASNPVGSDSKTYSLTLKSKNQAPAFTSAATAPTGTAGSSYAGFTLTASGFPAPSFTSTDITSKTGLTLNNDGTITGTVSSAASGSVSVSVTASNGVGTPATQSLTIPVQKAPTITTSGTTLSNPRIGTSYSDSVTASGFPTPTLSAPNAAGSSMVGLPLGLSMSSTGAISGTPSSSAPTGAYSVTVTASNGVGTAATKTFTLTLQAFQPSSTTVQGSAGTAGWDSTTGSSVSTGTQNGAGYVSTFTTFSSSSSPASSGASLGYTFGGLLPNHTYTATITGGCSASNGLYTVVGSNASNFISYGTAVHTAGGITPATWTTGNAVTFTPTGTTARVGLAPTTGGGGGVTCQVYSATVTQTN